jgi:hypothetical protein
MVTIGLCFALYTLAVLFIPVTLFSSVIWGILVFIGWRLRLRL